MIVVEDEDSISDTTVTRYVKRERLAQSEVWCMCVCISAVLNCGPVHQKC